MRILIQRVTQASVAIEGVIHAAINTGLLLFIGIEREDNGEIASKMAKKVLSYRLFADGEDKMNLNVMDVKGEVLAISQFTLAADTHKGLRPSFSAAAPPEQAEVLYEDFIVSLREQYQAIASGVFGANMQVQLINDGPVTFLLETKS